MTNQTDLTACREAFEKWLAAEMQDPDPLRRKNGGYLDPDTHLCWEGWQAAWNTRADQGGEAVAYCDSSDPHNGSAFAWPGTDRQERHSEALYTHPPRATAVEDERDAARYRWLRERSNAHDGLPFICEYHGSFGLWNGEYADREIDAALSTTREDSKD
jgi:hypothetical protein